MSRDAPYASAGQTDALLGSNKNMASEKEQRWWKEAVVYQIWPHSL